MDYPGFTGPSAQTQSPLMDLERTVNWYLERNDQPGSRGRYALYPTPGQRTWATTTDGEARALFTMNSRTHGVFGSTVREWFATQTSTARGTVVRDSHPATITSNGAGGNQLFVTSGSNGYALNLTTNALSQVLTNKATMGGMIDGFFVAFDSNTSRIWLSNLNDGTTWDPTQFAQRSAQPDPWVAMVIIPPDVWLIGEESGDVWYDAGTSPFPLAPRPGITFRYGTLAPFTVKSIGNTVLWLARDKDGVGTVVQTRGYSPQPISSKPLETAIAGYARAGSIADAEAVVLQIEGHPWYVLRFPSANATWVYDTSTQQWFEWLTWNAVLAQYETLHARVHTYAFGQHLVGDATGALNTLDVTIGTEADGTAIRRLRIPPALWLSATANRLFVPRLEALFDVGLGTQTGQGQWPSAMLRTTQDAKTWSSERTASAGAVGDYGARVFWTRNGSSTKVWAPEITVSDPIPWRLIGCDVDMTGAAQAGQAQA